MGVKSQKKSEKPLKLPSVSVNKILAVLSTVAAISSVVVYFYLKPNPEKFPSEPSDQVTYWVLPSETNLTQFDTVEQVSNWLGHRKVNGSEEDWDIYWSHAFPFASSNDQFPHIKPHQHINHFPGMTFLTNKM